MKYIITADWHLRSQKPRCRLDENWINTQREALTQIAAYAGEYEAHVIVVGDIFHSTNETTMEIIGLVQEFASMLDEFELSLYILAGNHDMPQHNIENLHRSAFNILLNSKNVFHINQMEFDHKLSAVDFGMEDKPGAEIIFKHVLCFPEKEKVPPNAKIIKPSELFEENTNAKYIFTGDYHRQFVYRKKGKKLLNPGCLLRQAADMIDYEPSCFLVDLGNDELSYKICPIVDDGKLVTDEYLETEKARNDRIGAFIERIKSNEQVSFDFIENVHTMMKNNKIDADTKSIILELMENT